MNNRKYHKELRETAACTKIVMEATKGICQKSIKGGEKDCLRFDNWFSSKKAEESAI